MIWRSLFGVSRDFWAIAFAVFRCKIRCTDSANLMANLRQGITEAKSAFLGDRDVLAVEDAIALKPKPNSMLGF